METIYWIIIIILIIVLASISAVKHKKDEIEELNRIILSNELKYKNEIRVKQIEMQELEKIILSIDNSRQLQRQSELLRSQLRELETIKKIINDKNLEINENLTKLIVSFNFKTSNVESEEYKNLLNEKLSDQELSRRVLNSLKKENIEFIKELIPFTRNQFLELKNIGSNKTMEVEKYLFSKGLSFAVEQEIDRKDSWSESEGFVLNEPKEIDRMEFLKEKLSDQNLSIRTLNGLKFANIELVGQLVSMTKKEVLDLRNIGKRSFNEILDFVGSKGLIMGMDLSKYEEKLKSDEV